MEGHTGRPDRPGEAAGAHRQRCVEIDGCLKRQNPAYRLTCIFRKKSGGRSFTLFLCVGHALFKWISAFSGITGPASEEQAPAGGPSRPPGTGPTPAAASSPSQTAWARPSGPVSPVPLLPLPPPWPPPPAGGRPASGSAPCPAPGSRSAPGREPGACPDGPPAGGAGPGPAAG